MSLSRSWYLSAEADQDLEDVFEYGLKEFGLDQAVEYVASFDALFELISQNPELGRTRNEIKEGLRSLVKESHVVFYRVTDSQIRIVRILHGSRDLWQHGRLP